MQLFMLPKEARCTITCLLLNAVKVDRDAGKVSRHTYTWWTPSVDVSTYIPVSNTFT